MIKLEQTDIPESIDWLKALMGISSAGIAAIAFSFKSDVAVPANFLWGVGFFFASTILTLLAVLFLIQHKQSGNAELSGSAAFTVITSFLTFLFGMGCIAVHVFR